MEHMKSKGIWDIEDAICPDCHKLMDTNKIDFETGAKYLLCEHCGFYFKLDTDVAEAE